MIVRIENFHRVTELDLNLYRYNNIPPSHYLGYRSGLFCMLTAQTEGVSKQLRSLTPTV